MSTPYSGLDPDQGMPAGGATAPGASAFTGAGDYHSDEGAARPLSSVGDIIADITRDLSTLMSQEIALAKAEVTDSATRGGKAAGLLGGAGVAGHFMALFLSIALWWALGHLIGLGWSALVVALIWGVVAAVLGLAGRKKLKEIKGMPQTVETTKEIPDALKGNEEIR